MSNGGTSAFPINSMISAAAEKKDYETAAALAGLTKRELFAAMAMQGLVTATFNYKREWTGQMTPAWIAEEAVNVADALIQELDKK